MSRPIRVAELFAGVGGFRIGLTDANKGVHGCDSRFAVVWSNQWEPGERAQHASRVYEARFGTEGHSNQDISTVDPATVPSFDLLVGGFPCQDYSVAKPLNQSSGLKGKKGVLWWDIHRFIEARQPKMALLENVDRLLVSPGGQRGRDFAVMLASLNDLGYAVEWRVINAADYGFPQRRKRVFIVAHRMRTPGSSMLRENGRSTSPRDGILAVALPVEKQPVEARTFELLGEPWEISEEFNFGGGSSPFLTAGVCVNRHIVTEKLVPNSRRTPMTLKNVVVESESMIPNEYFLDNNEVAKWQELKGAKRLLRTKKNGIMYQYAEGAMAFPDALDKPSRTIITSEGGRSASRFKHVIQTKSGRLRRLLPVELERLSGFPDGHTELVGITDARRAFFIGNALVTGIVADIGRAIRKHGLL